MARERAISRKPRKQTERRVFRVDNVRLGFASMDIVAMTCAIHPAKLVARPKKAVERTEFAAISPRKQIRTTNAVLVGNAVVAGSVDSTTAPFARSARSVFPIIASMACVAETSAPIHVLRAARQKKDKALMDHAGPSPTREIQTMNAALANVMARVLATSRNLHKAMERRAHWARNANRGNASTEFVVT